MSRLALLAVVLALVAGGCSGATSKSGSGGSTLGSSTSSVALSPPQLTDLRDIDQFRALFNSASGEPRLIVLVSPT